MVGAHSEIAFGARATDPTGRAVVVSAFRDEPEKRRARDAFLSEWTEPTFRERWHLDG